MTFGGILMVDDDEIDVRAVRRAMAKAGVEVPLHHAWDGQQALDLLRAQDSALVHPLLLLLDLNMPRMGGIEFMEEVEQDLSLPRLVVFVLTTSASEQDRIRAWRHRIAGYIVKGEGGRNYKALVNFIQSYSTLIAPPV